LRVNEYDRLFTNSEPDKGEEGFISFLNPNSLVVNDKAKFEPEVKNLRLGVPVQMMRKGYYVIDSDGSLNRTVSLKEGWVG
jgi:glutaminyl-tRNA synthetase